MEETGNCKDNICQILMRKKITEISWTLLATFADVCLHLEK
jgi:hypothetical protein